MMKVVEHGVDTPDNSESDSEKDFLDSGIGDSGRSNSSDLGKETAPTVVGGALKSNGFTVVKRKTKKAVNGQTWRERIQGAYAFPEDEPNVSDEGKSSSESQENSEWGGLSDDGREEMEGDAGGQIRPDLPHEETSSSDDDEDEDEEAENNGPDSKTNIHERAKQFTDWAREQSGFGGTAPNLSTLPQIPKELRKPVEPVPLKSTLPSDIPKKKVFYHYVLLTNGRPFMFM